MLFAFIYFCFFFLSLYDYFLKVFLIEIVIENYFLNVIQSLNSCHNYKVIP